MDFRTTGIWWSLIANGIAAFGGGIFFLTEPNARFRGMEPEAVFFVASTLFGALIGLFAGLPLSIRDLFWRRFRVWGIVGAALAFTPVLTAGFVSELAAWQLNLIWD
jgi:hypothetical protein